jgi:hypothetical protein
MSAIKRACGFAGTAKILIIEMTGAFKPRTRYCTVNGFAKPYIEVGIDWER